MTIKPIFRWYDLWIGFYVDVNNRTLYFFPVPMFRFKIQMNKEII